MTSGVVNVVGAVLERRYRVDALLASGGMSTVYSGVDLRLDRPVAIKVMDQKLAEDATFLRRFELEARAAAKLHHPHVVAVYDQGVDAGLAFLVMELVDGATLRDLLDARGALPAELALSVIDPIASALAAAHRAGLVHRDIKPENVLIGAGGAIKVADFGLVRAVAGSSASTGNVILGTVAYMSPEQVATGAADPRSDVYSLGVLLYEMLTGTQPYVGETALSVAYRHVNEDMPAPGELVPDLAPALDNLVLLATRRDPEARPADAGQFLYTMQHIRGALGMRRRPVPAPSRDEQDTVRTHPVAGPTGTRAIPMGPPAGQQPPSPHTAVYQQARKRSRRWLVTVTVLILILAALVGTGAWWFGSGRWTAVPTVTGQDSAHANTALTAADLTVHLRKQTNNNVASGMVIGTDPAAGTEMLRGDDVNLLVSSGRPTVPDVSAGSDPATADQAISVAGLTPRHDDAQNAYSASVAEGKVVGLSPKPGTPLPLGTAVTVVLSKGRAPVKVPDVGGASHDSAFAALRKAGLQPKDLPGQFSDSVGPGKVISTSPAAGTTVSSSASHVVGVVVSTAISVPSVMGQTVADARAAMAEAGLQVTVQQLLPRDDSRVFAQSSAPDTLVQSGTTITLTALP